MHGQIATSSVKKVFGHIDDLYQETLNVILGHTNLMFGFTSTATHYFAKMIYKCKLVGVA